MIMPRYGQNLEHFFEKQKCNISNATILEIALGTLDMLESVHAAGYAYNDLKLDNIMVGFQNKLAKEYKEENVLADASLHLVDFGFATRYFDKSTGLHMEEDEVDTFRGNMIFGSLNQLNFMTTSRRDDLISLCYMIIYMLNKGQLSGIDLESNLANTEAFKLARNAKENHTLSTLCCKNAQSMTKFAEEVFQYKFKETPNYDKLRKILIEAIAPMQGGLDTSASSIDGAYSSNIDENAEKLSEINSKMDISDDSASIIPNKMTNADISVINKVR
jgi:serine/threonine protein kinase